jgi:hypothetical protein
MRTPSAVVCMSFAGGAADMQAKTACCVCCTAQMLTLKMSRPLVCANKHVQQLSTPPNCKLHAGMPKTGRINYNSSSYAISHTPRTFSWPPEMSADTSLP